MSIRPLNLLPRSLRAQLACCFAMLGAVLAISLSLALGSMLAQKSRSDADAVLHTIAHNAARLLADGLALRMREVEVLAESPALWENGIASPEVGRALQRRQAVDPYNSWIGVADGEGVVRSASQHMLEGVSVKDRSWFVGGRRGPYVGDVHPAKLLAALLPPSGYGGPQRFVDFAAPIERDGKLLGVLGLHGSWEWTRAAIESLLPPAAERMAIDVFVFDRAGHMIYAPDSTLTQQFQEGQTLDRQPARGAAPSALDTTVLRWRDGTDCLSAAVALDAPGPASELGWTVVARQPEAVAYASARRGAWMALLMGLVAVVASAGLGWWLAARLTQPLRRIASDAQAIEAASTPSEMPQRRGTLEIEQLSGALSGMTRRLQQTHAELEQRVQARTIALERANVALEQMAHHDPLTGLLNRRGFDERMAVALSSARRRKTPLSVLIIDADHFKQVNDRFGHDAGDQVLKGIGNALRKRLREVDIVARIGGEEFVVVLVDTASLGASLAAAALVSAVQNTLMPEVGTTITISCGVAEMRPDTELPDSALRRADEAMYRAKQTGRNRHCMAHEPDPKDMVAVAMVAGLMPVPA